MIKKLKDKLLEELKTIIQEILCDLKEPEAVVLDSPATAKLCFTLERILSHGLKGRKFPPFFHLPIFVN